MTLPASGGRIVANGNGVTTSWPFNFIIPTSADIVVTITNVASGVSTELTYGVDYTAAPFNDVAGGTVTYPLVGSPLAAGNTLTIQRIVPYEQDTDLTNQDGFYADVLENAFDYLTMQTQQLSDAVDRALVIDAFGAGTTDAENSRIINLAAGTAATDAINKSQLDAAVVAAGNVPVPGVPNIGFYLKALTATTWGWVALVVNTADIANGAVTAAKLATQPYQSLASASTTDLTNVTNQNQNITGTTTINSFGTGSAGQVRWLKFAAALTITNSANIICPGGQNFVTEANDKMEVYCQGAGVWEIRWVQRANGGGPVRPLVTTYLTGSGTHTPQTWTRRMRVRLLGGGAAGGGANVTGAGQASVGSAGGAGAYIEHEYTTIAGSYSYGVGAGGTGVSAGTGGSGGNTTFGALTAGGGTGGVASAAGASVSAIGGAGGTPTGGNIVSTSGHPGGNSVYSQTGSCVFGGNGGTGPWGGSAVGNLGSTNNGNNAVANSGSGGTGGSNGSSQPARTGGNGGSGIIIVEEFPG